MGIRTARQMASNIFAFFRGLQRNYGDIVHLRLGPYHDYVFFHPDQIREVLVTKRGTFRRCRGFARSWSNSTATA